MLAYNAVYFRKTYNVKALLLLANPIGDFLNVSEVPKMTLNKGNVSNGTVCLQLLNRTDSILAFLTIARQQQDARASKGESTGNFKAYAT